MFFEPPLPIIYDQPLFRPPSEGNSAIFQATLGCSFNQCTFCGMYKTKKFKVRPFSTLTGEIDRYAEIYPDTEKVFIADGDALVLPKSYWLKLLPYLQEKFPKLRRVTSYATPQNILKKSAADLKAIRDAGLSMLYMGVESGDPETLEFIVKGVTRDEVIDAGLKAREHGFKLSCTGLLGIAGKAGSQRHAAATATIFNAMQPKFIGILIFMEVPGADLYERGGPDFEPIDTETSLTELRTLLAGLDLQDTQFRSNHASNYLALKGHLPQDKSRLLALLDQAIAHPEAFPLRPDWLRAT